MNKDSKTPWYKETTFVQMMIAFVVMMVVFQGGIWIVEGDTQNRDAIYLFGSMLIIAPIMGYLLRNNP